jgi:hypothetical protein
MRRYVLQSTSRILKQKATGHEDSDVVPDLIWRFV